MSLMLENSVSTIFCDLFYFNLQQLLFYLFILSCTFSSICCLVAKSCWTLCDPMEPATHQDSLSFTIFCSLLKFIFIESVMPPNNLILCHPLLLLPLILPSIRVFSNEPAVLIQWPKDWSVSFSIGPSNAIQVTDHFFLQGYRLSRV